MKLNYWALIYMILIHTNSSAQFVDLSQGNAFYLTLQFCPKKYIYTPFQNLKLTSLDGLAQINGS